MTGGLMIGLAGKALKTLGGGDKTANKLGNLMMGGGVAMSLLSFGSKAMQAGMMNNAMYGGGMGGFNGMA